MVDGDRPAQRRRFNDCELQDACVGKRDSVKGRIVFATAHESLRGGGARENIDFRKRRMRAHQCGARGGLDEMSSDVVGERRKATVQRKPTAVGAIDLIRTGRRRSDRGGLDSLRKGRERSRHRGKCFRGCSLAWLFNFPYSVLSLLHARFWAFRPVGSLDFDKKRVRFQPREKQAGAQHGRRN